MKFLSTAAWVIGAIVFSGCSDKPRIAPVSIKDAPLPDPPYVTTAEPGTHGGRLVVATFGDPKTFNPITSNESSSTDIIRFLFSSLTTLDIPTQDILPGLADTWTVEPDQKTWTFHLRKNLRWSDGAPLTADDVLFTWEVIYDPKILNPSADLFKIDGKPFQVTRVDDWTVRVVTPEPYAPFLEAFGGQPVIPRHILSQAVKTGNFAAAYGINTAPGQIVGCGPFVIQQFKPAQFTLLARNPYYYVVDKKGGRLPYLDNLVYMVVPDQNAISLRFLQKESDVHERIRPEELDRFKGAAAGGRFQVLELGLGLEKAFLWFNQNTSSNAQTGKAYVDAGKLKWFRNKKFRQAISHAIDRPSIVRSVYAGRGVPNYGYVAEENKKWNTPDISTYPYDLAKAAALLAEIGIKDRDGDGYLEDETGRVIEFVLNTNVGNNTRDKVAVFIRDDLKKLGVKVIYQPVEFNSLVTKIDSNYDYDCILLGLAGGGIDPSGSMNVLKSDGFTHQWFPRQKTPSTEWEARIDELMNLQIKTLDHAQRKKYFDEVQKILAEEQPMVFTVSENAFAAVRSDLGNVRPSVLSSYRITWNADELFFRKSK